MPAYAVLGKALAPVTGSGGCLANAMADWADRQFASLLPSAGVVVMAGDSVLDGEVQATRQPADITVVVTPANPDDAERFGILMTGDDGSVLNLYQKPGRAAFEDLSNRGKLWLDTGAWALSPRAMDSLAAACHVGGAWQELDLYGTVGAALGANPRIPDDRFSHLTIAVAALDGTFAHIGTMQEFFRQVGRAAWRETTGPGWPVGPETCLTGAWASDEPLKLPEGIGADLVPVHEDMVAVRLYGFNDMGAGTTGDGSIRFLNRSAPEWFSEASRPGTDFQDVPFVPAVEPAAVPEVINDLLAGRWPAGVKRWFTPRQLLVSADMSRLCPAYAASASSRPDLARAIVAEAFRTHVSSSGPLGLGQIVECHAPYRADLAGGWSDTPPYGYRHPAHVVNLAIEIEGVPRIQAKAGRIRDRVLRIESLDQQSAVTLADGDRWPAEGLGSEHVVSLTALDLFGWKQGGRLAIPFDGGLAIQASSSAPKGSGLGASSILAMTIWRALTEVAGIESFPTTWTLAIEQKMGAGGGWQDQEGGRLPGLKSLRTSPGDHTEIRPEMLTHAHLENWIERGLVNLFDTGITRVAHGILGQIVQGLLLDDPDTCGAVARIAANADAVSASLVSNDLGGFGAGIRRSWELNCALDSGTAPPSIAAGMDGIRPHVLGAKLLGAGGGGFVFAVSGSDASAESLRQVAASLDWQHRPFRVAEAGLVCRVR